MYCIFADIGQAKDYPAQGILQHVIKGNDPRTATDEFRLRWIERIELGTQYRTQVKRFKQLCSQPAMHGNYVTAIDGGGIGRGILELFDDVGESPKPICFKASDANHNGQASQTGRFLNVPKFELVQGLIIDLENDRFKIAKNLPYDTAVALKKEMRDLTTKIDRSKSNNIGAQAAHDSVHDDMIMAICIGLYWLKRNTKLVEGNAHLHTKASSKPYSEINFMDERM